MEPTVIFDAPFAKVTHLPENKAMLVVWNGVHTIDEYRHALTVALDYQEKFNLPICNYISDIRKQGIVNPASRKWFEQVAIPRATKQGLKHAAVVFDGNAFKKYYLNLILQVANVYHLPLKFFNTPEEAFSWFESFSD